MANKIIKQMDNIKKIHIDAVLFLLHNENSVDLLTIFLNRITSG